LAYRANFNIKYYWALNKQFCCLNKISKVSKIVKVNFFKCSPQNVFTSPLPNHHSTFHTFRAYTWSHSANDLIILMSSDLCIWVRCIS
jgi:hypothetical protein